MRTTTGTFDSSIMPPEDASSTIEMLLAQGTSAMDQGNWEEAKRAFKSAKHLLMTFIDAGNIDRFTSYNTQMVRCEVALFRCDLEEFQQSDMVQYDRGDLISQHRRRIIREIRKRGVSRNLDLWDKLEKWYDKYEMECQAVGRSHEAAEFNYCMMRARRFKLLADNQYLKYWGLTLLEKMVGFGHRLRYSFFWIAVLILTFAALYFIAYYQLGPDFTRPAFLAGSATGIAALGWRLCHSIWISFATLFSPSLVNFSAAQGWIRYVIAVNVVMQYFVNVILIALVVNKLASRRKW